MAVETRTGKGPFTVEDLERTPEDHVKREIIDGWLYIEGQPADSLDAVVDVTSPVRAHQDAVRRILVALDGYADERGGWPCVAPMDVRFADDRSLQPDVLYVSADDADRVVGRVEDVVPLLVVEVSSPSTRGYDLLRKRRVYEAAGVGEYWFVDVDAQRIEVYLLDEDGYGEPVLYSSGRTVTASVLPGFEVEVDRILG